MKHQGTKRLETERLILRRFTIEDAEQMYANWANDDEVTKYLTWPAHTDVEQTKEIISLWMDAYANEDNYQWCIELKDTKEAIGSISVVSIHEEIQAVEFGYCIGRNYWHQGYTAEALAAVITFFFDEVGVNRVEARHDINNPNSGAVMKKCGMYKEGVAAEGDWNNCGICDVVYYGLTSAQRSEEQKSEEMKKETTKAPSGNGKNVISDETIEYVGILAKLELSEEEKEQAKKDMGSMLDYIDKLNELDTTGVDPMSHVFDVCNVFREDVVENSDASKEMLANAPAVKDGSYKVPKTVE